MPLYEYKCKKCKHRFEKIRKFSDRPLRKCPECGGPVEQLVSRSAVQFKGSGFYATDYARKGGSGDSRSSEASDTAAKAAEKSESKKSESKTDSKTEVKTGSKSESSKSESKTESKSKKKSD